MDLKVAIDKLVANFCKDVNKTLLSMSPADILGLPATKGVVKAKPKAKSQRKVITSKRTPKQLSA